MQTAKNFYNKFGYQGVLKGLIILEAKYHEYIKVINLSGSIFFDDDLESLLPKYTWEIDIDTDKLNNNHAFEQYYLSLAKDVYWGLGYEGFSEDIIRKFLKQSGLIL